MHNLKFLEVGRVESALGWVHVMAPFLGCIARLLEAILHGRSRAGELRRFLGRWMHRDTYWAADWARRP